jgi:hypothetical protein
MLPPSHEAGWSGNLGAPAGKEQCSGRKGRLLFGGNSYRLRAYRPPPTACLRVRYFSNALMADDGVA